MVLRERPTGPPREDRTTMVTAALGWLGMAGTFLAYVLLWKGRLSPESLAYALLNTAGGLLGGTASALYGAWPSVASNVVWALVGLQSVITAWSQRDASPSALEPEPEPEPTGPPFPTGPAPVLRLAGTPDLRDDRTLTAA